uniref:C2H2-type domain-containing protein n=1 Tax=viral metagenome TaxID=1070528 RepID=A0A6C0KVC9_9ZZZZ
MSTEKSPKISKKYECEFCDYICFKNSEWSKHLLTAKHKKTSGATVGNEKISNAFCCEYCWKSYKDRSGLWRHKKLCKKSPKISETEEEIHVNSDSSNNIIVELLKQNQEFKDLIVEQNKQIAEQNKLIIEKMSDLSIIGGSNNNNCNNNNNNKTFNLQFFLNEQCKDALNIDDFVNQIKLQIGDLDMIGRVGYTEGMSKIIIRSLKELDVFKRPIHCSDLKREILYIKDNDSWEKEKVENVKLKNVIKNIECKNVKQLPQWIEDNPDSEDYDSKKHMEYHNIIIESMGGATCEDENKKHEKIIRNIAKEVVIDKSAV